MRSLRFFFILISILFCSISHSQSDAYIVLDENTEEVLSEKNAYKKMYPASLTKVMTIYVAFDAINKGIVSFDSPLKISRKAANMKPFKIGLKEGNTISLKSAIMSLIIKSANDSSVVIAENLAGSEKEFVKIMNSKAKQLGLTKTHFVNSSGWHHPNQKSTAYDMAKLMLATKKDFANFYHLFSRDSFFYKNQMFRIHSDIMKNLEGAKGMKTGYTSQSGWNIVTTATRGKNNLVGVVLGSKSHQERNAKIKYLLNSSFAYLKKSQS